MGALGSQFVASGSIFKATEGRLPQAYRENHRPLRHTERRLFRAARVGVSQNAHRPQVSNNSPEDAPARVYCIIQGVFPVARISVAARKQGVKVEFVKSDRDLPAELARRPETARPPLIVVDLNNASARPLSLIPELRAKLKKSASIIGIVSQIQGDLKVRGIKAGCDSVVSQPAFWRNLPNLLRRHGFETV